MQSLESYLSFVVLDRPFKPAHRPPKRWGRGPARNERYKAWIRTHPCSIPNCGRANVEAAHTGFDGGKGLKPSDYSCVPLCHYHHMAGPRAFHGLNGGRKALEAAYCIDFSAIVERLNAEWARRQK